jgi:ribonuclease HI
MCSSDVAVATQAFRPKRGWKNLAARSRTWKTIHDCYAIYRRIEAELKLTHVAAHVGTEGNKLADRMAMLAAQSKDKNYVCIRKE